MYKTSTVSCNLKVTGAKSLCDAIRHGVAKKKQKFKLARAVLACGNGYYAAELLEMESKRLITFSSFWRRQAIVVVIRNGFAADLMRCMFVLPTSDEYANIRSEVLEALLKKPHRQWLYGDFPKSVLVPGLRANLAHMFWKINFRRVEVEMILKKVLKFDLSDRMNIFLSLQQDRVREGELSLLTKAEAELLLKDF